jgi:cyclopropane fatty-acyl-phospholipid synthase-like methyltransferase
MSARDSAFDVVVRVEASHAYGYDEGFLRKVRRLLRPQGHFLGGERLGVTRNVVAACELDAERRRGVI